MQKQTRKSWPVAFAVGLSLLAGACQQDAGEQAVEAWAAASARRVKALLGPAGGQLGFRSGARLEVPAKLLQEQVTITLERHEPSLDLAGKDVVGKAYGLKPRLNFAPGAAKLSIPRDRTLPGAPATINLRLYFYGREITSGPLGQQQRDNWQPFPYARFSGTSRDGRLLEFDLFRTPDSAGKQAPFGLLQVAFDSGS